jgi:ABC-type multidrug transport system fused ATPase/permease subunit
MPDRTALPQTLLGYILQVSRRHQLALWGLSVVVFLLSAAPLEIQRRIVNDAIRTGSIDAVALLALAYFGLALAEGAVKLCLNVYRAWVSERAVLDLRHAVSALALTAVPGTDRADAEGKEISMMLSEVEPIGGFVGISISEPLLQMGILGSVFGYLMYLEPLMAVLCVMALAPQMLFVPMMQRAINRRAAERIETLRRVGGDIVGPQAGGMAAIDQQARLQHVFTLNMGIFKVKFAMNFLMNLMHHLSVATALGVGAYFVLKGRIDVGTVVAFVSGLGKLTDPWGDLVNWFREMTTIRMRYQLLTDAIQWITRHSTTAGPSGPPTAT